MAGKSEPLVSIVIVNWNGLEDTKVCLEHTKKQTYKNTEVIIVDNGSVEGSIEYLRSLKDITLVENPKNLGFTGGHIAGYNASHGELILLLNNDAIMADDYIKQAVEYMQTNPQIGALGGRAYMWDDDNPLFKTDNHYYAYQVINPINAEGIFARSDAGVPQEVNNVSGSCVMVRRSVTEEVGYLHDRFFAYFEESDLFARMKRANYKIMYHPHLAIWHANAKSSNRKAPTFMYYMLMRNRFRFAVRNFDSWSLTRFLKFYLIMGLVSIAKTFMPLEQRPIHQAYAKAFLYNIVFGWKAFKERAGLKSRFGASNYNQLIVREQTGISVVAACTDINEIEELTLFAKRLLPIDEVVAVSSDKTVIKHFKESKMPANLRLCIDRRYFDTHPENLGAIVAKQEWLIMVSSIKKADRLNDLVSKIYFLKRNGKKLAVFFSGSNNFANALSAQASDMMLIERSLLIDAGGLEGDDSISDGKRRLMAYAVLNRLFYPIKAHTELDLPYYHGKLNAHELRKQLSSRVHQARLDHKKPSSMDKVADRYYRIAQLRNLIIWLLSFKIPVRLKLGRLKATTIAVLTLNRGALAEQLKHMRNEAHIYRDGRDVVALKKKERKRLDYMSKHPEETIVFIIMRDRLEPVKKLLNWLGSQGLKKIVFVDNDSKLPDLVEFLHKTDYQVLELKRNMAQTALWSAGIIKVLLPEDFYIVTDPDIIPARNEKDVISHLYNLHKRYEDYIKVGLGLKIDDLPDHYALKEYVIDWESQFWKHPLEDGVYEAGVDTTFALYKPFTYKYILHPSIRTGKPYTARHLPWYANSQELSDEDIFYRLRADESVNSWDTENLPERYKIELERQQR